MVEEETYVLRALDLTLTEFRKCRIPDDYLNLIDFVTRKIGDINKYGDREDYSIIPNFEGETIFYYNQKKESGYHDIEKKRDRIKAAVDSVAGSHRDIPDGQHIAITRVLDCSGIARIIESIAGSDELTVKIEACYHDVPKDIAENHGFPPKKVVKTKTSGEYEYYLKIKKH